MRAIALLRARIREMHYFFAVEDDRATSLACPRAISTLLSANVIATPEREVVCRVRRSASTVWLRDG